MNDAAPDRRPQKQRKETRKAEDPDPDADPDAAPDRRPQKQRKETRKAEDPDCTEKLEKVLKKAWKQLLLYVVQWVFSVIAFAKTAGYSGRTHLKINCTAHIPLITEAEFGYPFRLPLHPYKLAYCDGSHSDDRHLKGDFSIPAEFFLCMGVITFLYCTVTLVFYMSKCYSGTPVKPIGLIGLIIMGVFAFLWLVCSSMWAKGVVDIKWATDPHRLAESCVDVVQGCTAGDPPLLGPLYTSVAFGFLCVILWILMIIHSYCQRGWEEDDNLCVIA